MWKKKYKRDLAGYPSRDEYPKKALEMIIRKICIYSFKPRIRRITWCEQPKKSGKIWWKIPSSEAWTRNIDCVRYFSFIDTADSGLEMEFCPTQRAAFMKGICVESSACPARVQSEVIWSHALHTDNFADECLAMCLCEDTAGNIAFSARQRQEKICDGVRTAKQIKPVPKWNRFHIWLK